MELDQVARQLRQAATRAPAVAAAVVSKGALNVKNEARANATRTAGAHARRYPGTFGYDLDRGLLEVSATVGPEARGQGNLGPILEDGTPTSPGHRDLGRAADAEERRFGPALATAFDELLP